MATITVVLIGFVTIVHGFFNEVRFVTDLITNPYSLIALGVSAILLIPLWRSIRKGYTISSRSFAGLQVLLILFAAFIAHYPELIITNSGAISILENTAPDSVITVLGISLIVGGLVILPGLFHLLKSFKMIKVLEL